MQALLGVGVFCGLAWCLSTARSAVRWRVVFAGLAIQVALAVLFLYVPGARYLFDGLNGGVAAFQSATAAGTAFVFGFVGGGPPPYAIADPAATFILAFNALPLVIVLSALTALLTYWRVLPWVIGMLARGLQKSLAVSGAVSFGAAANIFLGMVEAPLFVRPYLLRMTRAEIFILTTTGMSTIAGTVLVLYATILAQALDNAAAHLLIASVLSVPAGIAFALIMVPETELARADDWIPPRGAASAMEAISNGTQTGLTMCLQITAMLLVLVSLVHLANLILGALLPEFESAPVTLELLLGVLLRPMAWLLGIPWHESAIAGQLLGTKIILNELLAYLALAKLPATALAEESRLIMTYALCGFANIGSLGILIAGMAELVPARRSEIIALGPRAVIAGTLATCCTGAIIGLVQV